MRLAILRRDSAKSVRSIRAAVTRTDSAKPGFAVCGSRDFAMRFSRGPRESPVAVEVNWSLHRARRGETGLATLEFSAGPSIQKQRFRRGFAAANPPPLTRPNLSSAPRRQHTPPMPFNAGAHLACGGGFAAANPPKSRTNGPPLSALPRANAEQWRIVNGWFFHRPQRVIQGGRGASPARYMGLVLQHIGIGPARAGVPTQPVGTRAGVPSGVAGQHGPVVGVYLPDVGAVLFRLGRLLSVVGAYLFRLAGSPDNHLPSTVAIPTD